MTFVNYACPFDSSVEFFCLLGLRKRPLIGVAICGMLDACLSIFGFKSFASLNKKWNGMKNKNEFDFGLFFCCLLI